MTEAERELLGRHASYNVTDMSVGNHGLLKRLRSKADNFREYISTTCCGCLASVPSFALVILGVVLVMLLIASIPLAFTLTYMKGDSATAEMPHSSVRVFREHDQWSNSSEKIPDAVIFKSSSLLPPNITPCKGFGFACTNEPSRVIATYQRCDGIEQCADGSDEVDCHRCQTTLSCASNDQEKPMRCLRGSMICDGIQHCVDGADEKAYCKKNCAEGQRKCNHADICLSENMICDGDVHCPDGEDEQGCEKCKNGAKMCKPSSKCIPKWQLCDGNIDCPDKSDELDCDCKTCSGNAKVLCDGEVKMCLDNSKICDGKRDCPGGEDEEQCPGSCKVDIDNLSRNSSDSIFRTVNCGTKTFNWRYGCSGLMEVCNDFCESCNPETSFDCELGKDSNDSSLIRKCVHRSMVCDGKNDCGNNADEENCGCDQPGLLKCSSLSFSGRQSCYSEAQKCDGFNDCPKGEDESSCEDCKNSAFHCSADKKCIASTKRCDGIEDCSDGSDEMNCSCQECMLHPLKMYMCSSGARCFRLNDVCSPYSQCPDADERDKLYCAVSQGGGRSYL